MKNDKRGAHDPISESLRAADPLDGEAPSRQQMAKARVRMLEAARQAGSRPAAGPAPLGARGWQRLAIPAAALALAAAALVVTVPHDEESAAVPGAATLGTQPTADPERAVAVPDEKAQARPPRATLPVAGDPTAQTTPSVAPATPDGRRQIVFTTPGGTRLYWTLDTRPGPERPIEREELRCHEH
jgi:hypothetical protein